MENALKAAFDWKFQRLRAAGADRPAAEPIQGEGGDDHLDALSCINLLDVEWDSFEAYLAGMSSGKRHNILSGAASAPA
ncbi:hypothetical protein Daura_47100 [Dactylosporangium aurantiacum]|uniref:Uncharacterized protein n=1 Tax=Dactylosporangium aurantiacum TaxID=35754 RepID=A0A9Q9IGW7_9ACTN|nr:hypothetical protein [Dactylosporangium aurantiacum]MDG6105491.1 hypothetical protein [Dactylosporangium aurantiacum]UWZ53975.1 hypothetical protein Daura_47100 [Dactylosporangium aurantiacum]